MTKPTTLRECSICLDYYTGMGQRRADQPRAVLHVLQRYRCDADPHDPLLPRAEPEGGNPAMTYDTPEWRRSTGWDKIVRQSEHQPLARLIRQVEIALDLLAKDAGNEPLVAEMLEEALAQARKPAP